MIRVAVAGRQGSNTPGSRSPDGKYLEYSWNAKRAVMLADAINSVDDMEAKIFGGPAGQKLPPLQPVMAAVNAYQPQVYIDLCSGSVGNFWADHARVVTMYCRVGDTDSHRLGIEVGRALCAATGFYYRGASEIKRGAIVGSVLPPIRNRTPLSLQIEWGFHTSRQDLEIMTDAAHNENGAKAIADRIWYHFSGEMKPEEFPVLRNGDSGDTVKTLQASLRSSGFNPGPIDGIFGPKTEGAVRSFQKLYLGPNAVDGVVGPMTWAALLP